MIWSKQKSKPLGASIQSSPMKGRVSVPSLSQDQLIFRYISFRVPNQYSLGFIWVQVLLSLTSKHRYELKRSKIIQVKCQVQPFKWNVKFNFTHMNFLFCRLSNWHIGWTMRVCPHRQIPRSRIAESYSSSSLSFFEDSPSCFPLWLHQFRVPL